MITDIVQRVTFGRAKIKELPKFKSGDTISVHVKVKEGDKERTQLFKGVVIKVQGSAMGRSFTVRKMSSGVGVERTFPFTSPAIEKIIVNSRGKVRRSKIFYLRALKGRAARLESELVHAESTSKKKLSKKAAAAVEATPAPKVEDAKPAAE